jgi:ComF family protein
LSNFYTRIFDDHLSLAARLIPPVCLLCGDRAGLDGLCGGCRDGLPVLPLQRCPVCAVPNRTADLCGRCLQNRPAYDRVVATLLYAFPVNILVHGLKYRGNLAWARPLAAALVAALDAEPCPDLVIAMPLPPARLRSRGFNQAMELARLAQHEFGFRIATHGCRRIRDSVPQATLPWKERASNVRGVFSCELDLEGKRVAVVDDVLTTGATLNELAVTLKKRGADQVVGWIAARTPPG